MCFGDVLDPGGKGIGILRFGAEQVLVEDLRRIVENAAEKAPDETVVDPVPQSTRQDRLAVVFNLLPSHPPNFLDQDPRITALRRQATPYLWHQQPDVMIALHVGADVTGGRREPAEVG